MIYSITQAVHQQSINAHSRIKENLPSNGTVMLPALHFTNK